MCSSQDNKPPSSPMRPMPTNSDVAGPQMHCDVATVLLGSTSELLKNLIFVLVTCSKECSRHRPS